MHLESQPFDLRSCIRNAVYVLSLKAKEKGLLLKTVVEDDVPGVVVGDAGRLRQVVLNLVGNAVKVSS